jgi:hypothetical protein
MPTGADGASLFKWTGAAYSSTIPTWVDGMGWYTEQNISIALGESFFIDSPVTGQITFVGEVQTGDANNPIQYSLPSGLSVVAPKTPVAQRFPGSDIGNDGDSIFTWTGTAWNAAIWQFYQGIGWDGPDAGQTAGPMIPVGGGVVYQNTGATLNWTRTFNPQ